MRHSEGTIVQRQIRGLPLAVLAATGCMVTAGATAAEPPRLPPQVIEQLRAVYAEKASRTEVEQKISSQLLYPLKAARGALPAELLTFRGLEKAREARWTVDVKATVTQHLLDRLADLGVEVESTSPRWDRLRVRLAPELVDAVAEQPEVRFIAPEREAFVHTVRPYGKKLNTSEGDVAHQADVLRQTFGVDGTGVRVGVISDSVEALAALQASGDLPPVTVLPGQAGSGSSEGTAMLEIVHDLAPGAQLFFATASPTPEAFADNILALANVGCQVIVDDVSYSTESPFQDDVISQAVASVAADGVLYFSSAGNAGNLSAGTSGVWQGNYTQGPELVLGGQPAGSAHLFSANKIFNRVTRSSGGPPVTLQWSDPLGASANDYDLCIVDNAGALVLGCSTDVQNGDDDPLEILPPPDQGMQLLVLKKSGEQTRFLHLNTNRGGLELATAGQVKGHPAAPGAIAIAAVNVATAGGGAFVGGGANPPEVFTSDGPRRVFYHANGAAITPGNVLVSGGALRQVPQLAAADRVMTATPGFNPFPGTSAAAPHAAALAALLLEVGGPATTRDQVYDAMTATALDISTPGFDRNSGYGIIDVLAAAQALAGAPGGCTRDDFTACLLAGRFRVSGTMTNGQGVDFPMKVMSFGGQRAETDTTAFFESFIPGGVEYVFKMIDACGFSNTFWGFLSGTLTNQETVFRVVDTVAGVERVYMNPPGQIATGFQNTSYFETCQ